MALLRCICALAMVGGILGDLKIRPEIKEKIEGMQLRCETEVHLDPSVVEEVKRTMEIPNDEAYKCFIRCMMTHMEVLTEDGTFLADTAMEHIPEELQAIPSIQEVMNKCKDERGENPCDSAYKIITCFAKESKDIAEAFT